MAGKWPEGGPPPDHGRERPRVIIDVRVGTPRASAFTTMHAVHVVAKLHSRALDLRCGERGRVVWAGLERRFTDVLIAIVMPDHLHVIGDEWDPDWARAELANLCGRLSLSLRLPRGAWQRVPPARVIAKRDELRRQFRYVALNECRAGIARDPLEAQWSSYREMFGAVVHPLVHPVQVMRRLGAPRTDPREWLHGYVSGDPAVAVEGTPLPAPAALSPIAKLPLGELLRAAAAATRESPARVCSRSRVRRTFVWLARACGWKQTTLLAEVCRTTPDAIRKIARAVEPEVLARAALNLGDPRLLARISLPVMSDRTLERREFRRGSRRSAR